VHADAAQWCELVVIGEDRAAVTEATERFAGKSWSWSRARGAELAALVARAKLWAASSITNKPSPGDLAMAS